MIEERAFPITRQFDAGKLMVVLGLLLTVVSRLPFVFFGYELNVDESAQMVLAKRMAFDWMPWRSADYLTCGPLNAGFLALLHCFGIPIAYVSAHAISLVLLLSILLMGWRLSAGLFGPRPAALAFFSVAAWLSCTVGPQFAHYGSELLPSFLVAAALCLVVENGECSPTPWKLAVGFFIIGLVPWVKLQAAPIALAPCIWIVAALRSPSTASPESRRSARLRVVIAAIAALSPTLIMLLVCDYAGTLAYFWNSYILNNLFYSGSNTIQSLWLHIRAANQSPLLEGLMMAAVAALIQVSRPAWTPRLPRNLLLPALLLAAAFYAVFKPVYDFPHYQIFLIYPILLAVAYLFRRIILAVEILDDGLRQRVFLAIASIVIAAPILANSQGYVSGWWLTAKDSPTLSSAERSLSAPLAPLVPRKASLFVWGWAPSLYLDLDARPSTRYPIHQFLVQPSPYRDFMRRHLLQDLQRERPEWIVVVEKTEILELGSTPPFPELQSMIDKSYGVAFQNLDLRAYRRNATAPRAD